MAESIRFNLRKTGRVINDNGSTGSVPPALADGSLTPSDVLQGAVHAVLLADQTGHILDASEASLRLLGQTRDELMTRYLADVIVRLDEVVIGLITSAYESGRNVVLDVVCCRHDGSTFFAECSVFLVSKSKSGGKQIYFLFSQSSGKPDAGELMDARLARAERLEMAGTLAGQIAHDFNNLLTPLLAYPELVRRELAENRSVTEYIDIMEKTAGDMSRLTQQLLSLARRGQVGNDEVNINTTVEQVVKLMGSIVAPGISIDRVLADNLLPVKGGKDQIRRVVENLCQNAVDAMGDKGELRICTENIYLDAPIGQYEAVNIGEYVKISISDTGPGIPLEIREKIFDPFFTTKRGAKNRGSGLGLSIVHGIVRDHHGYIDLDTAVGRGSSFFVFLPVFRNPTPKLNGLDLPHGSETILVVDDDELQVNVLVSLLQALGYRVMGVQSGEECVHLVRDEGYRFNLIVLDMILSDGMDGLGTYEALRKIVPDQKVVLISGFSKAARSVAKAQELGAGIYLRKPLTIERVARTVRDALDGTAGKVGGAGGSSGKRILIVDDEQMIRKLFGMIIVSGIPDTVIDQADNGMEAVKAFEEGHHDLIVMDLQMPVMDGREAFAKIGRVCAKKKWSVPPVIFCTGFAPHESLNSIVGDENLHCLMRKPVKADALLEAVRQRIRS